MEIKDFSCTNYTRKWTRILFLCRIKQQNSGSPPAEEVKSIRGKSLIHADASLSSVNPPKEHNWQAVSELVINFVIARAKLNTGYRSTTAEVLSFLISEIYSEEGIRILHRNFGCCSRVIPYHNTYDLASLTISAVLRSLSVSLQQFKN